MTEKDEEKEKRREWDKLKGPRETEDNWRHRQEVKRGGKTRKGGGTWGLEEGGGI